MTLLDSLSQRERSIWIELFIDVVVMVWYLPKAWYLLLQGDEALMGRAMGGLITETIGFAIVLAIAVNIVVEVVLSGQKGEKKVEPRDERDAQFELRSYRFGYHALIMFVVTIIGYVVILEYYPGLIEKTGVTLSPVIIAHYLLLCVFLASLIKSGTLLFYYRRGY
jgi:hypothetical protein